MRIAHVSTVDVLGGASRMAWRLHHGLRAAGIDSCMLVQDKCGDDVRVHGPSGNVAKAIGKVRPYVEPALLRMLGVRGRAPFSPQWLPGPLVKRVSALHSDLIHLHWICDGFARIEHLSRIRLPVVWTFHDTWPLTGGCHYPGECAAYERQCGNCPALGSKRERDLSRWVWNRKQASWAAARITVVAPSKWMAECARRSSLFGGRRIEFIPNGVDSAVFRPMDQAAARERAGLPLNRKLVLFSAMMAVSDSRKGFSLLRAALGRLGATRHDVEVIVLGSGEPENPPDFGMKVHYVGRCQDDLALALLYACADVLVVPSQEDNCPNTILEAMATGVPSVAFRVGGISDLIRHEATGYLSPPRDAEDLCAGLRFVLEDPVRRTALSQECRRMAVAEYDIAVAAKRYVALYEELLAERA